MQNSAEQNNLRNKHRLRAKRQGIRGDVRMGVSPFKPTVQTPCKQCKPSINWTSMREVWQGKYFPTVIKRDELGPKFFRAAARFYFN